MGDEENINRSFISAEPIPREKVSEGTNEYFYRRWGSSDRVLLCLPPWPASSLMFAPLGELLSDTYSVIAPDYPGWGGVSLNGWKMNQISDYTQFVDEFVRLLDIGRHVLLGYSFGTVVAQVGVAEGIFNPDGLVIISGLRGGKRILTDPRYGPSIVASRALLRLGFDMERFKGPTERAYTFFFKSKPYKDMIDRSAVWTALVEEIRSGDARTLLRAGTAILSEDTVKSPPKQDKTLVIAGEKDFPFVFKDCEDIANVCGETCKIIPSGDHMHLLTEPESSFPYIQKFLKSVWR